VTTLHRVLHSPAARDFRRSAPYLGCILVALAFFPAIRFMAEVIVWVAQ
jgi:hypothetical protein